MEIIYDDDCEVINLPHVQQVQFPYDQSQQGKYQQLYNLHYNLRKDKNYIKNYKIIWYQKNLVHKSIHFNN